ncbi:hypothetical protein [Streptomyces carpinensis]|uniref:ApeA N-terminal domain-containing protein n=1 Tax=Streptomyces carpinensis TaxID=66369 RepID=A0ABV1VWD8_9ACTN|nr:hypothetical protein [Streptomyces carpinensis]
MDLLKSIVCMTENSEFIARCNFDEPKDVSGPIQITFIECDTISNHLFTSGTCRQVDSDWEFRMPLEEATRRRLIRLTALTNGSGSPIEVRQPQLFLEPATPGAWEQGDTAESELARIESEREARYQLTLKADDVTTGDPVFSSVTLVDGILLTANLRVPGINALRLEESSLGSDGVEVLNSVLPQLGFTSAIAPQAWMSDMRRRRPAIVLHMPSVQATDVQSASDVTRKAAHQLLDLLALKRGSRGRIVGGALGLPDPSTGKIAFSGSWIEGGGYEGNLMGGFVSGEDPAGLFSDWQHMATDPRIQLWLSLYADALSENRWDYRLFRCFNLIEGIAKEVLPRNLRVVDSGGNPILKGDGKPYTVGQAQGAAYELIKKIAHSTNQNLSNFVSHVPTGPASNLWDEVGIWTSVRNSVAHKGSWALPHGTTPDAKHLKVQAEILRRGDGANIAIGAWVVVRSVRTAVESVIRAGFRQMI